MHCQFHHLHHVRHVRHMSVARVPFQHEIRRRIAGMN
jgi:hypothetical protein